MADNSLLIAGVTSDIAAGLLSISSTYEQGKLRRVLNNHNATMKDIERDLVKFKTGQLIDRLGSKEDRELAAARAASVGEGFALDSGTNLAIEGDIIKARATDRAIIRSSGGLDEARLEIEAGQSRLQGSVAETEAGIQNVRTLFGTTNKLLERVK